MIKPYKIQRFFQSYTVITVLVLVACAVIGAQSYFNGEKHFDGCPYIYTHYNNYLIFKDSFFHLIHNQDLYQLYPFEHLDFFKYSPTFSLFFGLFSWMPDLLGICLWNLANAVILLLGIKNLPGFKTHYKAYIVWFILMELILSQQNEQSNNLMTGLMVWGFALAEKRRFFWSVFLIVCSIFVKIFSLPILAIYLFYPQKFRNSLYFVFWMLALFFLPLVAVSYQQLMFLYQSWGNLLQADRSASIGLSIYAWLSVWFHLYISKTIVFVVGAVLFCLPLVRSKMYHFLQYRLWFLASMLIWGVIFNYKAESPSFVIAVTGVALWFFSQKMSLLNKILLALTFIFTILASSDVFPPFVRKEIFQPYVVKAVPCILVWFVLTYQLLTKKPQNIELQ